MTAAQAAALHALTERRGEDARLGVLTTRFGHDEPEQVIWTLVGAGLGYFIRDTGETWAVNVRWQPVRRLTDL